MGRVLGNLLALFTKGLTTSDGTFSGGGHVAKWNAGAMKSLQWQSVDSAPGEFIVLVAYGAMARALTACKQGGLIKFKCPALEFIPASKLFVKMRTIEMVCSLIQLLDCFQAIYMKLHTKRQCR